MELWQFAVAMGIPTAITGLFMWYLKRYIDKRETAKEEQEKNKETLMLMIMQTSRATNVLAEATAKAVQRIPDARCNGDMTAALEQAQKIQREEKEFLINQGVAHIFNET